jgi:hypothetical protein
VEVLIMQCDPILVLVVGIAFIWLVVLSRWRCRSAKATPVVTKPPRAKRDPKPFAGFTHKPECPLCEQEAGLQPSVSAPPAPPPRLTLGLHKDSRNNGHRLSARCNYAVFGL